MAVRMILFILILAIYYIKNFKIRNSCSAIPLALIILSLRKTVRYELQFSNFVVGHEYFMKCSVIKDCFYFCHSYFQCYYKDPKSTEEAFTDDGYYKTGDLMYRDENDYYFFVDRYKMLLKYKNYQVCASSSVFD